jgi:hypothetical protein
MRRSVVVSIKDMPVLNLPMGEATQVFELSSTGGIIDV